MVVVALEVSITNMDPKKPYKAKASKTQEPKTTDALFKKERQKLSPIQTQKITQFGSPNLQEKQNEDGNGMVKRS